MPAASRAANADESPDDASGTFQLQYAPHVRMFRNAAGEDLVDQLKFAAHHGFRASEDNQMKSRSVDDQTRVARAMEQLDMQMDVFVAHGCRLRASPSRPLSSDGHWQ